MTPAERQAMAQTHIDQLAAWCRAMEAEGDYRAAQDAADAAADWQFWADYGVEWSTYEQINE